MRKSAKKGFTLIELIIVIAILGILAAVLIPKVIGVKGSAQQGTNRANARQIQSALAQYFADEDGYPANATQFSTALQKNLGKVPTYKDGSAMGTYGTSQATGASATYTFTFNEDDGTEYLELNKTMTPGTETSKLFK